MRVQRAFLQTLGTQFFQTIASVSTGVLIARGLGPAGQGRYATLAASIAIGTLVASLGQFHGNVLAAAGQRGTPRLLLVRAAVHGLGVLIVSLALVAGGLVLVSERASTIGVLFAVVLTLETLAEMVRGINLGQHHIRGWNIASLTQRVVYFAALALLALRKSVRLELVLTSWAVATLVSVLVSGAWIWLRSPAGRISLRDVRLGWGARLAQSMRAFVTVGTTLVLVRADMWMLRPMLGAAQVGQMSVATYLAEWMWYVPSILGNLLFAVVASDRSETAVRQVARSARLVTTMLAVPMIVLLISGRWLVHLMYGPQYHEAAILFTVLLPGMTALGIHLVIDSYFAGTGFPPVTIMGALAALAAKVTLNLLVVPAFGVVGAAVATSTVYVALLALKVFWFRRTTGISVADLFLVNADDVAYVRARIPAFLTSKGSTAKSQRQVSAEGAGNTG